MYCYCCARLGEPPGLTVDAATQSTGNINTGTLAEKKSNGRSRWLPERSGCVESVLMPVVYCGPGQQEIRALCTQVARGSSLARCRESIIGSRVFGTLSSQRSRQESISVAAATGPTRSALCNGPSRCTLGGKDERGVDGCWLELDRGLKSYHLFSIGTARVINWQRGDFFIRAGPAPYYRPDGGQRLTAPTTRPPMTLGQR